MIQLRRRPGSVSRPTPSLRATRHGMPSPSSKPRIKICGLTDVKDARHAVKYGADLLGMILWSKAKRSVSLNVAREIVAAAAEKNAEGYPKVVGVFVDENAEQIEYLRRQTNIDIVQLHGDGSREALPFLDPRLAKIYVLHANMEGQIETSIDALPAPVDFVLIDGLKGGSGVRFPLDKLTLPEWIHDKSMVKHGWLLAGGLDPENVAQALQQLHTRQLIPAGVDVSSGVCDESGLRKSPSKIESFIRHATV